MKYIGKIDQKKNGNALITVTKELPCGQYCRGCSAGCKFYMTHIQIPVPEDIEEGDIVRIERLVEIPDKSDIGQYVIPAVMIAIFVLIMQIFPRTRGNSAMVGLSLVLGLISAHFVLKYYNRHLSRINAKNFVVGKKLD